MTEEKIKEIQILIEKFIKYRQINHFDEATLRQNQYNLKHFLNFLKTCDEENIREITSMTLQKYQAVVYGTPGIRGKILALSTQRHFLCTVQAFFQWLVASGLILSDPSSALILPREKKYLPRNVMTVREVEKILKMPDVETPRGLRNRAIMEILYCTGLRSAEIRNLKVYDVKLEEREVFVRQGKGGKDRVVPLGEVAKKYLELYLREARQKILKDKEDPGELFVTRNGRGLSYTALRVNVVKKYADQSGVKKHVSPHEFRHACATHLLKGRANIRQIQALLGHESLESTQIYTHVEIGDLKQELKRCHPREQAQ